MHQVVVDSINRVDLDLRKSLFSNVVLSGGSTLCRGQYYLALSKCGFSMHESQASVTDY